jgi:hypothetical protein
MLAWLGRMNKWHIKFCDLLCTADRNESKLDAMLCDERIPAILNP